MALSTDQAIGGSDDWLSTLQRAGGDNRAADPAAMNAAYRDYQGIVAKKQTAMQPAVQKFNQAANVPHPAVPDMQPVAKAPDQKDFEKDTGLWVNAMFAFAALAGGKARGHATTALRAFAGGVKGLQDGQQQAFKNAYDTWQGDTKAALDNNKERIDRYKAILDDLKLTEDEAVNQMTVVAHEFHDQVGMVANRYGDFAAAWEVSNKAHYAFQAANDKVVAKKEAADAAQASQEGFDWENAPPDKVLPGTKGLTVRVAKEKGEQAIYDPSVLARGGLPMADKNFVMDFQTKMMADAGISPTDIIALQSGLGASKAAVAAVTKQYAMVKSFEDNAEKNMKIVENLMDKGAGTEAGSVVNRWLQAGKKATGDADVIAFNAAMIELSAEVAKITSGATGAAAATEGAAARIQDALSAIDSPAGIHKTFDAVWRPSMKNRTDSLLSVRDGLLKNIGSGGKSPIGGEPTPPAGAPAGGSTVHWDDWK